MHHQNNNSNKPFKQVTIITHYNVGQKIRIIRMDDNNGKDVQAHDYNGKVGIIKHIDGIGQLHLEGGGLAVNPEIDEIEIIG